MHNHFYWKFFKKDDKIDFEIFITSDDVNKKIKILIVFMIKNNFKELSK